MKLLLDTHAFLFWVAGDPRVPRRARAAIEAPRNTVALSAASVWEMRIKIARGSLRVGFADICGTARGYGFALLPIAAEHAELAGGLPRHHDDPFDRMLIAQARCEGMTLVTRDGAFAAYGLPLLWE